MKTHLLDIFPDLFDDIASDLKSWEMREIRDRNFQVGDQLLITDGNRSMLVSVVYIMKGPQFGLKDGWCIMSIKRRKN